MKIMRYTVALFIIVVSFASEPIACTSADALVRLYKGDAKGMLPVLAPDVTWIVIGDPEIVPFAGTYEGRREVMLHFVDLLRSVRIESVDVQYAFPDENGRLHVIMSMKGIVRANGNSFDMQFAHLISFDDNGMIVENRIFFDTSTWWAAFNGVGDFVDRRVGETFYHMDRGNLGASTQTVSDGYTAFAMGDVLTAMSHFTPTGLIWILKGDAIGDALGEPDEGIGHVGRWEGVGDPYEQPFPTWGFLGSQAAMNMHYEYVMPEPPDYELPFKVQYIGSNGNFAGVYFQEIQRNRHTQMVGRMEVYHFLVLDENQKVRLGLSIHDNAALCVIDPNCAFHEEMQ